MAKKEDAIKTRIELDGEAEYKKAAAEIKDSLYMMSQEMKLVTTQFADNAKSTEALTAKQDILKKQYEENQRKVSETASVLAKLENQEEKNEKSIRKYQIELLKAQTELAKTGNELNAVERDLASAGSQVDNFTGELKKTSEEAVKTADRFESLGKTLGAVGSAFGTAIAALGTAAIGAGTTLASMTVSASKTADELLTTSQVTRQSTEDLQKYAYAAKFVDVSVNTLTTSMTRNIRSMDSARNGVGDIAESYQRLGITITSTDGMLRDSNDVYWEVIDALKSVESATERDALSMQLLGKAATELNPLINKGSEAFKAYGKEAEQMGIIMGDDQVKQLGAFRDTLDRLTASLGALKNAASMIALPFMDLLAGEGTDILSEFSKGIQSAGGDISTMGDIIGKTLGNIVTLILNKLPELIQMGVNIIKAIIQGIADNAGLLAEAALQIVETLISGLQDILPILVRGALMLIDALAKGIAKNLPVLIPMVIEMIITIIKTIAENIPMLINSAVLIIDGLITGILNAVPLLIAAIPEIIFAIINAFANGDVDFIEIGVNIMRGVLNGIVSMFATIWDSVKGFIENIVSGIKNVLGIKSPSSVFANIGENMAAGIGIGFADEMEDVRRQLQNAIPTEFNTTAELDLFTTNPKIIKTTPAADFIEVETPREVSKVVQVIQNIYTPQYNYAEQQRAAAQQFRQFARQV